MINEFVNERIFKLFSEKNRNFNWYFSKLNSLWIAGIVLSNTGAGGIPVGIALARQRLQHQETSSSSVRNVSLSHHTSHHASYHHFQPDNFGNLYIHIYNIYTGWSLCSGTHKYLWKKEKFFLKTKFFFN